MKHLIKNVTIFPWQTLHLLTNYFLYAHKLRQLYNAKMRKLQVMVMIRLVVKLLSTKNIIIIAIMSSNIKKNGIELIKPSTLNPIKNSIKLKNRILLLDMNNGI